jgi:hypothetical protein
MQGAALAARTKGITTKINYFESAANGYSAAVRYGPNPGWIHIMDSGTQPHFIGPKGRGKRSLRRQNLTTGHGRKSYLSGQLLLGSLSSFFGGQSAATGNARAIDIKGIGPKAYAFHPGAKGKHFVTPAIEAAKPLASQVFRQEAINAFERAF